MKKMIITLIAIAVFSHLTGCTTSRSKTVAQFSGVQWDFDHQVQFRQTTLTKKHYQLEIIPNKRVGFDSLATFLLRKSFKLCKSYHYNIEMIQGIEGIDDKRAMPNHIQPNLMAIIECSIKKTPTPK